MKVYIICEFNHSPEDEIHRIIQVVSDLTVAQSKADLIKYFYEEWEVDAPPARR